MRRTKKMDTIRLTTESDLDTIFRIINDAAQAYKGIIPADRWHEPYMPLEALKRETGKNYILCGR